MIFLNESVFSNGGVALERVCSQNTGLFLIEWQLIYSLKLQCFGHCKKAKAKTNFRCQHNCRIEFGMTTAPAHVYLKEIHPLPMEVFHPLIGNHFSKKCELNDYRPAPTHFILHTKYCTLNIAHIYWMLHIYQFTLHTAESCMSWSPDGHAKIYLC